MTTPLKETSKYVTIICHALARREDNEHQCILAPAAINQLRIREEELRYSVLFGRDERLKEIAERLIPIFKNAWVVQKQAKRTVTNDDPANLRILSDAFKGLVVLGNAGYFKDPTYELVVILNHLIDFVDGRERLFTQAEALRLPDLP